MKDLRGQARVSAFLRKSLADGAQDVLKLETMARRETLLGEHQRITDAKAFKRAKYSLRIRSVRAGFGPNGSWRWVGYTTVSDRRHLCGWHWHSVRYADLGTTRVSCCDCGMSQSISLGE